MNPTSKPLLDAVKRMREAQRTYFRTRSLDALTEAKQAEGAVDKLVKEMEKPPEAPGLFVEPKEVTIPFELFVGIREALPYAKDDPTDPDTKPGGMPDYRGHPKWVRAIDTLIEQLSKLDPTHP